MRSCDKVWCCLPWGHRQQHEPYPPRESVDNQPSDHPERGV